MSLLEQELVIRPSCVYQEKAPVDDLDIPILDICCSFFVISSYAPWQR